MNIPNPPTGAGKVARRWLGLLLAAPLLLACGDTAAPLLAFWEGNLSPIRPSLVAGRVVAVSQHGKTDIGINVQDGEPGVAYGWRVEAGTCDAPGKIQGGPASYPPLVIRPGGTASAEASVGALFKPGKRFAARVYLSPDQGGEQVVACGELEETSS